MIRFVVMITISEIHFGRCLPGLCANGRCCDGFKWEKMSNTCIACLDGFFGKECNTPCRYPTYGRNCQSICSCRMESCDIALGCWHVTSVPRQTTTYHRSSGLITTLLTTLKVVHNVADKNTNTNHPINNSTRIHSSKTALLRTSIAVLSGIFLLLLLVYFFVFVCQKLYKNQNMFQDLSA